MPIRPRITYSSTPFNLTWAQQKRALLALMPDTDPNVFYPNWTEEDLKAPWDGTICLLSPTRQEYGTMLQETVKRCRIVLARHRVRLDCYIEPNRNIRLNTKTRQMLETLTWNTGQFQLGRAFGGAGPTDIHALLTPREVALDPASVLLILTIAVMERGADALQPMSIDCPGAQYDPEDKGKFADCPRIDVFTDPSEEDEAFISIDWNWENAKLRARANHGAATFLPDH